MKLAMFASIANIACANHVAKCFAVNLLNSYIVI